MKPKSSGADECSTFAHVDYGKCIKCGEEGQVCDCGLCMDCHKDTLIHADEAGKVGVKGDISSRGGKSPSANFPLLSISPFCSKCGKKTETYLEEIKIEDEDGLLIRKIEQTVCMECFGLAIK